MVNVMRAHAKGPVTPPLLQETIGDNLRATARQFPDHEALIDAANGVRLCYGEFDGAVDAAARSLLAYGIEPGDRVGIWSPNRAEWVVLQYATARIGVILVTLNPAYRTSELTYALTQSGCRFVFAAETFKTSDYRMMLAEVATEEPTLERTVFLGTDDWLDFIEAGLAISSETLHNVATATSPTQPINIQYTSGTTGHPKGVTLSHHNILNNGYLTGDLCRYTDRDRVCVPVPLYHCFGMVLGCLACTSHGAAIVLPGPSFDAETTLRTVEEEACSSLYGVPTMFIDLLETQARLQCDVTSLRTGIMAGAPCPVDVMRRVTTDLHMPEVTICYGMTEVSPVASQTLPEDDIEHRVATVGAIHPHVELKIVDPETGSTMEREQAGEICIRGYSVMLGYWEDARQTAKVVDGHWWMHSGDLGTMSEASYVNIVGRIKDMIIRGGENLYPREVEEFLMSHPAVLDAQVVGVPDDRLGEELLACVELRTGAVLTEEELREYCRGRIAHFKIPRYVMFVDEFPLTVTGKVQKYKLRELGIDRLGLRNRIQIPTA